MSDNVLGGEDPTQYGTRSIFHTVLRMHLHSGEAVSSALRSLRLTVSAQHDPRSIFLFCTEAVCNARWSIRHLSVHRMVSVKV
jgi:hypothetical protein